MNLKEIDWKKFFTKKLCIIYGAVALAIILAVVLVVVLGGGNNPDAEETSCNTPTETTPAETTPAETTTKAPEETVTYPSDAEEDPKQEDVFYQ